MMPNLRALGRFAARAVAAYRRSAGSRAPLGRAPEGVRPRPSGTRPGRPSRPYPGDWTGPVHPVHRPRPDGEPDPGEVVWTWVPYQEDHRRGKDRPVLVVDRHGEHLLCLMLTSRDRSGDLAARADYLDVGTGPWDRRGRASEVKLDRVLQVLPADVRREGAVLPAERFRQVAEELRRRRG
ncbi:type II toxin-antitoxin system PemK/MazF family toxin [Kocuria sabuli]|uniref:type II toxin-antitoxin system PemK/MazF family toxin n=1 Tax=Kocuria sabuli TaxID=3071448 RepID=UPI0034D6F5E3